MRSGPYLAEAARRSVQTWTSALGEPLLLDLDVEIGGRPLWIDVVEGVEQQSLHGQSRVPFPVSRDDEPGCGLGGGAIEHGLIRVHVIRPQESFVDVAGVVLPVLVGPVEAFGQPLLLLVRER